MCTPTTLTTPVTQPRRYRMVPLAALERAQGELQSAYQKIVQLEQQLMAYEATAYPMLHSEIGEDGKVLSPGATPVGTAVGAAAATAATAELSHEGSGEGAPLPSGDRGAEPHAASVPASARCTCGHAYAAHTYRGAPKCSLCGCPGFKHAGEV